MAKQSSEWFDGLVPNYVHWRRRWTYFYSENYFFFSRYESGSGSIPSTESIGWIETALVG